MIIPFRASAAQALADYYREEARGRVGLIDGHVYEVKTYGRGEGQAPAKVAVPCEEPSDALLGLGDTEVVARLWSDAPKSFHLSRWLGEILRPLDVGASPPGETAINDTLAVSVKGACPTIARREWVAREDRMLPCMPTPGPCPQYAGLLNHLSGADETIADALESVVGAALMGVPSDRILILNDHVGGTGKSTWLAVVRAAAGGYACDISGACLSPGEDRATAAGEIVDMAGRRLAIAPELSARAVASARAKQVASHEPVIVREAYSKPVTVTPTAVIVASCNSLPDFPNDAAIARRLIVIPTTHKRPERPDPGLADRIIATELPHVLYRLILAGARVMRDGLDARTADANIAPEVADEVDVMGAFLSGWEPGGRTLSSTAWARYIEMCRNAGVEPDTRAAWGRRMGEMFGRSKVSHSQRFYEIHWGDI